MKAAIQEIKRGEELMIALKSHLNQHTHATDLSNGVLQALEAALSFLTPKQTNNGELDFITCSPTQNCTRSDKKRWQKNERDSKRRKSNNWRTIFTPAPHLDGYQWIKYGQKTIQKSTYPRNYYRCTHRGDQGCLATKLVQQQEEEYCDGSPPSPFTFQVIYINQHTCNPINYDIAATSPQNQIIFDSATPNYDSSNFISFESKNSNYTLNNMINVGKQAHLDSLISPQSEGSSAETKASSTSVIDDFSSWDLDLCEIDFVMM